VGLVADDVTGATDSAVEFASAGWEARLVRHLADVGELVPRTNGSGLTAVTTACRSSADDEAADVTATAVQALSRAGTQRLYLKIDSTVRGSVAGQIAGALAAWRRVHPDAVAVICPAFPDLGRTVAGGVVLVEGVPVAVSAAGADPLTPVTDSVLERIIPGSLWVPSTSEVSSRRGSDRFIVDSRSNGDLAAVAAMIDRLGPRVIAVGSAGLARAMAARWTTAVPAGLRPPPAAARRVLVAVNSMHPAAQEQVAYLLRTVPDACLVGAPNGSMTKDPSIRVVCTSAVPNVDRGSGTASLVRQVVIELESRRYDAIVLVGGDGALAVLDELQARGIAVTGRLSPGVPRGVVIGGQADGLPIVTRSGGFGDARALVDAVRRLRNQPATTMPPGKKEPQ
jgi:uncharacterized protein YgbK (DUF1537 family)